MSNIKRIVSAIITAVCTICISVSSYAADNSFLTLDYTNSKKLITSSDDLFSNFETLMPGDIVSDTLSITNSNNNTIELFFKSIPISPDEYYLSEDCDLLNKINLKIDFKNKIIYEGPLVGTELSKIISLGKFKPGESGDFKFTLTVPCELTNEFNMTATRVKWYFAVNEDELQSIKTNADTNNTTSSSDLSPHTGLLVSGVGLGGIVAVMIIKGRRNKND